MMRIRRIVIEAAFVICVAGSFLLVYFYTQILPALTHFSRRPSDTDGDHGNILFKLDASLAIVRSIATHDTETNTSKTSGKLNAMVTVIPNPPIKAVAVTISNTTLNSYRSLQHVTGSMEANKMHDDYTFCPRQEPFLSPPNFHNQTKNPCWFDNGVFRCLPYFYLAGFSKCGTSDLFYKIEQHPDIAKSRSKEKHWFDYSRFFVKKRFIQNYTNKFSASTTVINTDMNSTGYSYKITGDGTPCYIWGSLNWPCYQGNEGLTEPRYTNADIIYRLNPKTKVIVMLREPVSRLYSRMLTWIDDPLHPVYKNASPESFHTFIEERIKMHVDCFKQWSVRHCAYNGTLYKEAVLRLMEGSYSVYIKDWLKVFPREQMLFIKFEDYVVNMSQTLKHVMSFLELAPIPDDQIDRIANLWIANKGNHYSVGPILPTTRTMLQNFYRPFNEELPELLGNPEFNWDYDT